MELLLSIIEQYGWQSLVVAVCTFALIECIKPLARRWIIRVNVRHTLYTALNYIFTLGGAALLMLILGMTDRIFTLYGTSIIVVNILYPVIANVGFFDWAEGIVKSIAKRFFDSGEWKKVVADLGQRFGIDEYALTAVMDRFDVEYASKLLAGAKEFFRDNEPEILLNLKQKLAGFADNKYLQELAERVLVVIRSSWVGDSVSSDKINAGEGKK